MMLLLKVDLKKSEMKVNLLKIVILTFMFVSCIKNQKINTLIERKNGDSDLMLYNAICGNSVTLVKEAFERGAVPDYWYP